MMDGDTAINLAGDLAALIFAWLAGSVVLRLTGSASWRAAVQRGLGLALLSLMAILLLKQALPDLFVVPLVFFVAVAVDILTTMCSVRPADRYMVSILISLSIVGSFVLVDFVLRAFGYHLTAVA